jgi:predicted DNA-binding ribbon-helix-helix protein
MSSVVFKVALNVPQVESLQAIARQRQTTVAALIRQAINETISQERKVNNTNEATPSNRR